MNVLVIVNGDSFVKFIFFVLSINHGEDREITAWEILLSFTLFFKKTRKGLYRKYVEWERSMQTDVSFYPGVFTQLSVIIVGLWWIFY